MRWVADLIVDGGGGIPWAGLSYEDAVGLEMNSGRMIRRRAYHNALAYALANSLDEVPASVVAAACESRDEADRLAFDINAARSRAGRGW